MEHLIPSNGWSTYLQNGGLPTTAALFFKLASRHNLTDAQLSVRLGYDPSQISHWRRGTETIPSAAFSGLTQHVSISSDERFLWTIARLYEDQISTSRVRLKKLKNADNLPLQPELVDSLVQALLPLCLRLNASRDHDSRGSEFSFLEQILNSLRIVLNDFTSFADPNRANAFISRKNLLRHVLHPTNLVTTEFLKLCEIQTSSPLAYYGRLVHEEVASLAGMKRTNHADDRIAMHCVHLLRRLGDTDTVSRLRFLRKKSDSAFVAASCLTGAAFLGDTTASEAVAYEIQHNTAIGQVICEYERVHQGEAPSSPNGAFDLGAGSGHLTLRLLLNELLGRRFLSRSILRKLQVAYLLRSYGAPKCLHSRLDQLRQFNRAYRTDSAVDATLEGALNNVR